MEQRMQILTGVEGLKALPAGVVISIGNYDGVHRGHQQILARGRARRGEARGRSLAVVTFEPHPLTVLRPEQAPPRLTPSSLKRELIAGAGADYLVILPPEPGVLNLSAEEFFGILRDGVRPSWLVEGDSFYFGKARGGTVGKLREWIVGTGIQLEVIESVKVVLTDLSVVAVGSSLVRWLVGHGRMRDAAVCLGRPYVLEGPVITGKQRGRTLGIPTANLDCGEQLVPADGVYAARCSVEGVVYPAALSIGTMPTFEGDVRQIEAHLVGFSGDLYGKTLRVEVLDWLRDQMKFKGVEALKEQMGRDIEETVLRRESDPARGVGMVEG